MKLPVINLENKKAGSVELSDSIGALKVRKDIIHRLITWQLSKRRAGTHKAKLRAEITGTTKKSIRQKGSGGARHGSKKAPIFRGGGKAFAPQPRDHAIGMPKKMRALALKHVISSKIFEGNLIVVDEMKMGSPKTAQLKKVLDTLGLNSVLFVGASELDKNLVLAAQNLINVNVLKAQGMNAYSIMQHKKLVLSKQAIAEIEERFA